MHAWIPGRSPSGVEIREPPAGRGTNACMDPSPKGGCYQQGRRDTCVIYSDWAVSDTCGSSVRYLCYLQEVTASIGLAEGEGWQEQGVIDHLLLFLGLPSISVAEPLRRGDERLPHAQSRVEPHLCGGCSARGASGFSHRRGTQDASASRGGQATRAVPSPPWPSLGQGRSTLVP